MYEACCLFDADRIQSYIKVGKYYFWRFVFFVPVYFLLLQSSICVKQQKTAVLLCLYGMFSRIVSLSSHTLTVVGVACRKRVQRYSYFLNYKTFYKEIFEKFSSFFIINWYTKLNKIKKITHFRANFANDDKIW